MKQRAVPVANISTLWYAYCSAYYLNGTDGKHLEPPFLGDPNLYTKWVKSVRSILEHSSIFPNLPRSILFLHSEEMISRNWAESRERAILEAPTTAWLMSDVFTNIGPLSLPVHSSYHRFLPIVGIWLQSQYPGRLVGEPQR
jgi:hypothetical protein